MMKTKLSVPHGTGGRMSASLGRLFCVFAVFCGLIAPAFSNFADGIPDAPAPEALSSNRFLFVFDTSFTMRTRVEAVVSNMTRVIMSGADGQLRRGDSIGIWTFNEHVSAEVPLLEWLPDDRKDLADAIGEYLKKQHYTGKSVLDTVCTNLRPIVRNSDALTTIIMCAGEGKMSGTPGDEPINAFLETYSRKGRKELPITIVMQSLHGKFTKYSLQANPGKIVIPALPPPAPKQIAMAELPPAPARPKVVLPPLILVGTKSAPKPEPAPVRHVEETPAPATANETAVQPITNLPVSTQVVAMEPAKTQPSPTPEPPPAPVSAETTVKIEPVAQASKTVATNYLEERPANWQSPGAAAVAEASSDAIAAPAANPPLDSTAPDSERASSLILFSAIGLAGLAVILTGIFWIKTLSPTRESYITRALAAEQKADEQNAELPEKPAPAPSRITTPVEVSNSRN